MNTNRAVIIASGILVVLGVAVWWGMDRGTVSHQVDLIAGLAEAEKRSTAGDPATVFTLADVTIDGVTKKCIEARPHSRLVYTLTVPPDAWIESSFALRPESWDQPGNGAQFRIGVREGRTYEELLRQYVNPKRGDRRWFSARLDLSAYEGRQVQIVLNTDPGPPGDADTQNDLAVWAEPQIYSKR